MYDSNLPQSLKEIQHWFGEIIAGPINEYSDIEPIAPSGLPIQEEAKKHILPSPTLEAWERLQIYNQQYWWRLLSILHENLPLVVRLFGYRDFNQTIGMPFLKKYPPNTWSLVPLGSRVPQWIKEEYHDEDKQLIYDAAKVDVVFNDFFVVKEHPTVSIGEDIASLLDKKMTLQEHIHLFYFPFDLLPFRQKMLQEEPEHWEKNDFPKMEAGDFYYVVFRRSDRNMGWSAISEAEYLLLSAFKQGGTINEACSQLSSLSDADSEEAIMHLSKWFQTWAARNWLCDPS